ncbi:MAG: hypothetical protein V4560_19110 [Bacteroidota bacterium]
MKTKHYINFFIALTLALSACKKSNSVGTTDTPVTVTQKYLVHVSTISTVPGVGSSPPTTSTSTTDYTYDSKKRLSKIKSGSNASTYTYNDSGDLFSIYSTSGTAGSWSTTEFTYADGKLISYNVKTFINNALTYDNTFTYVYNGDKVTELHQGLYYYLYTYDSNGNIAKVYNHGSTDYYLIYTYDNKKSRFAASPFKYPSFEPAGDRYSPNNRITSTTEGLTQNFLDSIAYTYDADGYPITSSTSSDYKYTVTTQSTYTYSTLQ